MVFRLIDQPEADKKPNLDFVLDDGARTVQALRDEGRVVLLHCAAAESRMPTVGTAYAACQGVDVDDALPAIVAARPAPSPNQGFVGVLRNFGSEATC